MGGVISNLLSKFQDPEVSSSFAPLLIHALAFIVVPAIFGFIFYKKFKQRPKKEPEVIPHPIENQAQTDEIKRLHEIIAKLERECAQERETNAAALSRSAELETQVSIVSGKYQEALKQLDKEHGGRLKLEEKVKRLEKQLEDAIRETERIFQQDSSKNPGGIRETMQVAGSEQITMLRLKLEDKEEENRRLKDLLQVCKIKLTGIDETRERH